ncbi:MAG: 50S ribosomal protein L6 [Gammaproteobacteria bacterium]|nr:50S ribosomal protein L6 [Gammaproteobacteria bacterium]
MSRVAKNPVILPQGVDVTITGQAVVVKGPKGTLNFNVHPEVEIKKADKQLEFSPRNTGISANAQSGTTRAILNNMVTGVTKGFERKLQLVGVGYRAQAQGKVLNLTLGFSHPVSYKVPEGITVETPSQTDIIVKGLDRQLVGQVAANLRNGYRPPEPYKGKGIRYADEQISLKEAKKK